MLIVSYDISNDKLRTKFSKYLLKYGRRIQYSVFEIKNSQRMIKNIKIEIESYFKPKFSGADSILLFHLNSQNLFRYGHSANDEKEILFF